MDKNDVMPIFVHGLKCNRDLPQGQGNLYYLLGQFVAQPAVIQSLNQSAHKQFTLNIQKMEIHYVIQQSNISKDLNTWSVRFVHAIILHINNLSCFIVLKKMVKHWVRSQEMDDASSTLGILHTQNIALYD